MASYEKRKVWRRLPLLLWWLAISVLSLLPSSRLPKIRSWSEIFTADKFAHAFVYAIFAVLLYLNVGAKSKHPAKLAILIAALYGALVELLQHFSPTGRAFELADILANLLGACLGLGLYMSWKKFRQNK